MSADQMQIIEQIKIRLSTLSPARVFLFGPTPKRGRRQQRHRSLGGP